MKWPASSAMSLCTLIAPLLGSPLSQPAVAASGREPVIVIPGVGGSEFTAARAFALSVDNGHGGTYTRLYGAGEKVWVNTWEAIEPGHDDYFDALKLGRDGVTPVAPELYVSGIYGSAYDDLIGYLQRQGYVLGVDLWLFPYDWRRDVRTTQGRLDALITHALAAANGGRVDPATWTVTRADIVAHSMGGLVGRSYISDPDCARRVDQLITLGSPQLGTPKFLKALIYGDDFGPSFLGIGLNPDEVRDVVQNMPGGMALLPSRDYYAYYDNSDAGRLRPYVEDREVDGDRTTKGVLNYDGKNSVERLLLNLGKNGTVLAMAKSYHDDIDRGEHGSINGVRWVALTGHGYGTLGQIREYTGTCLTWSGYKSCPKRDEIPVDGDGTVATMSSAMGDPWEGDLIACGAERWYVERSHGDLVKRDYVLGIPVDDGPVLPWIGQLLAQSSTTMATDSASTYFLEEQDANPEVTREPARRLSGLWIAALGPVALEVLDIEGRATGRARGEVAEIPDSRHETLPGSEFVFVKHDMPYLLHLAARGSGSVDLKVRVLGNGKVERTAQYLGVGVGPASRAQLLLPSGVGRTVAPRGWPTLAVDADGDGRFETHVPATSVLIE